MTALGAMENRPVGRCRKHHGPGATPGPFETIQKILQRHAVEADVLRADPEIDTASLGLEPCDPRQIAKAERTPPPERRRTESPIRIGPIHVLEREAGRRED